MKTILIFGGHGFLGSNLAKKLQKDPTLSVSVASRRNGVDLFDLKEVKRTLWAVRPNIIYQCAANFGSIRYMSELCADILRDNLQMNLNLYEAVKEECSEAEIIHPLSNCTYPGDASLLSEEDWQNGPVHPSVSAYGNAKRAAWHLSECYRQQYGIKTKNIILPNAFGPGDHTDPNKVHAMNAMILRMIQAKRKGDPTFEIWGSGNPVREWGYIDDLTNLLILFKDHYLDLSYPINIAQHSGFKIKESATIIAELLEYKGELVFNTNYPDGAPYKILDNKKFKTVFPHYCFFDHREAIRETIKYYEQILV